MQRMAGLRPASSQGLPPLSAKNAHREDDDRAKRLESVADDKI
jgi:hypothetical protein